MIKEPRVVDEKTVQANVAKHGRKFDSKHQAPWYCYKDGENFVQGWYIDEASIAASLDLAREKDVAGVLVWVLDAKEPASTYKILGAYMNSK